MNPGRILAQLAGVLPGGCGEGPLSVRPLAGSSSGKVYALQRAGSRWLLRYDPSAADRLAQEFQVLQALQAEGVAPQPVWLDAGLGVMLCEYVDGVPWSDESIRDPMQLDRLARLLARVHRHRPAEKPLAPLVVLERYLQGTRSPLVTVLLERCRAAAQQLGPQQAVLCHCDLWRGNIIQGQSLRLIDWEYAACADPLFDLATVLCYHELAPAQADVLWDAYREESGLQRPRAELDHCCVVVDTLTLGWALSRAGDSRAAAGARPFAARAARRLGLDLPAQQP